LPPLQIAAQLSCAAFYLTVYRSIVVEPNVLLLWGSWRVTFLSQTDNYALWLRTPDGGGVTNIDEDNELLDPFEVRDDDLVGWSVTINDWGEDPGQGYVEARAIDENTFDLGIQVTHGTPNRPYDDAVLRFQRLPPPKR
jgi:hypothetical protein